MIVIAKKVDEILACELADSSKEFAMLAIAKYNEERNRQEIEIIEAIVCDRSDASNVNAPISQELQMKLLKYCKTNHMLPVVIHSHVCYNHLRFSPIDTQLEKAMLEVSEHIGREKSLLSILICHQEYLARLWREDKETHVPIENWCRRTTYA